MGHARRFIGLAAVAAVSAVGFGSTALGQPAAPPTVRTNDPAIATLLLLKTKALAQEDASPDTVTPAQTAAWRALFDAAMKVRVGRDRLSHPLAGYALIEIALEDQQAGLEAAALEEANRSLDLLRPFRDDYPDAYAQAISTIGFLQTDLGRPGEAAPALGEGARWYESYFAGLAPAQRTPDAYTAKANMEFAYAQSLLALGRADEAVVYQKLSLETRRAGYGPNDPDTVSATYQYAIALFKAGRKAEAETFARLAVQTAIDHVDQAHPSYARALETLGLILARVGRRSESAGYFLRAAAIKRKNGGTDLNFFFAQNNLADSLLQLERYEEARVVGLEAEAGFRAKEGDASQKLARARALVGLADAAQGRTAAAVDRLGSALAIAREQDAKEQVIGPRVLPLLVVASEDLGRHADAVGFAARLAADARSGAPDAFATADAELLQRYVEPGGGEGARAAAARRVITAIEADGVLGSSGELPQEQRAAVDLVLRVAARAGDAPLGLEAMVVLTGSKLAQANRLVAQRIVAGDAALAARIREQQDAASAFQAADTAVLEAQVAEGGLAAARTKRDAAAAQLDRLRAGLAADYPRWSQVSGVAAPDLAALQAGLREDQAVLAATPAFDGVYTLLVTRRAAVVRRAPLGRAAIVALVEDLRASLPAGAFDAKAAHALYQQFFPAADAPLLRGVASLRIVASGPLAALPFATLLQQPADHPDRNSAYLVRRFALEMGASFAPGAVAGARAAGSRPAGERFLGVGAPTRFGDLAAAKAGGVGSIGGYFRGAGADSAALATLPPLPGALEELQTVARDFGAGRSRLLVGGEASEARLRAMDLRSYSTLLFATHGLVSGEVEGVAEPSLVLAPPGSGETGDGLLTASEVAQLALDADWVILSACDTAAGGSPDTPAYSGLAQAFRYAGARTLLLSHWPVRDDAASYVVIRAIAAANAGVRRDVALRRAMLSLMASRTVPDAADPYVWAPYILVDD